MPIDRNEFRRGQDWGTQVVENNGTSPVFQNIECGEFYIRAYPSARADVGKKIRLFGIDENGQVIRKKNSDGILEDGVELTLAAPFVSTSFRLRTISRVLKDETQGVVRLYQYDAENDVLKDCATYDPSERSPDYRSTIIRGFSRRGCCGTDTKSIAALVKLEFIPVQNDYDLVLIRNIDALKLMMQSQKMATAGKIAEMRALEMDAVREMNLELRDKFPVEQTAVEMMPFGTALPYRRGIGRVV